MEIKIKLNGGIMPTKGTAGAAAYDLYNPSTIRVRPSGRLTIKLGFSMELPKGYCALIFGRSGNTLKGMPGKAEGANKERFRCDVNLGLIDEDYRGEVGVLMTNHGQGFTLRKGERIAQMLIQRVNEVRFAEVEELSSTERGEGGFGSTDREVQIERRGDK